MSISKADVLHIAGLAKLNISEGEIDTLTAELEAIIGFADMLSELEASEEDLPSSSLQNIFREDLADASYDPGLLLGSAPCSEDGYYLVPDVKGRQNNGAV